MLHCLLHGASDPIFIRMSKGERIMLRSGSSRLVASMKVVSVIS